MKRGWKIFWIIVASITGLGIIFCCIAVGLGLTFNQIEETYPNGIGFIRDYEEDEHDWDEDVVHAPSSEMQEFQNISGLRMNVGFCKVRILQSKDNIVKVDTSGLDFEDSENNIWVSESDGILSIEMQKDGNVIDALENISGSYDFGTIYVYLPKEQELEMTELTFGAVEMEADKLKAKMLTAEIGAAECSFEKVKIGEADISVGTGELSLSGNIRGNISVECGVGDVEMDLKGREEDYNYTVECGVGSVEIGENTEFSGLANDKKIDNGSSKEMILTCGVGNIEINYE